MQNISPHRLNNAEYKSFEILQIEKKIIGGWMWQTCEFKLFNSMASNHSASVGEVEC